MMWNSRGIRKKSAMLTQQQIAGSKEQGICISITDIYIRECCLLQTEEWKLGIADRMFQQNYLKRLVGFTMT
ncbi:unnamed protein product [Caenorhabditis brenneri]